MIVYADVLFFINFVSSYVILFILEKTLLKTNTKKSRLILAAAEGGLFAAVIFCVRLHAVLILLLRTLSAIIMVFTAFFRRKEHIFRYVLWLFAVSGTVVAAMLLITMAAGGVTGITVKNGTAYFALPERIFLPLFIASYILAALFLKIMQLRRAKRRYTVNISHRGKNITVTALFDSGNLLREPVTGKSVSLIEWESAKKLFDVQHGCDRIEEYIGEMKLWAVPFHGAGGQSGIIYAFMADSVEIPENRQTLRNTFIGLHNGKLSVDNEYQALLNSALI